MEMPRWRGVRVFCFAFRPSTITIRPMFSGVSLESFQGVAPMDAVYRMVLDRESHP